MPIDPNSETLVSFFQAGKDLPRRRAGKKTHVSCFYRWTNAGCRGVILESIQVGGTRCTSKEAITRFFDALTVQAKTERSIPEPPRPTSSRRKQIQAAERKLARAGI